MTPVKYILRPNPEISLVIYSVTHLRVERMSVTYYPILTGFGLKYSFKIQLLSVFQIEHDFSVLYPEKELLLLRDWENFFNNIVELKKQDLKENKDPTLTELFSHLENENLPEGTGHIQYKGLFLIHLLIYNSTLLIKTVLYLAKLR